MAPHNIFENESFNSTQNLTSLWAFSEGFLGGILSAIKIPFKGLLLGNISVSIIILIANFNKKRGSILKAGTITTSIKAIISPYSTLPAYFAVFTQTLLGEFLFFNRRHMLLSSMTLGILTSVLSSVQRIIVLTILFGSTFWESIDSLAVYIYTEFSGSKSVPSGFNFSEWLIGTYILIHALTGFAVGFYVSKFADKIKQNENIQLEFFENFKLDEAMLKEESSIKEKDRKNNHFKFFKTVLFIFLASSLVLSYCLYDDQGNSYFDSKSIWIMIFRSLTIMVLWVKVIGPFLNSKLKLKLLKSRNKYSEEIHNTLILLPSIKRLFIYTWKYSDGKGFKKITNFISLFIPAILILNTKE